MADWSGPEDDNEELYGEVANAFANPTGGTTYADENGAAPTAEPKIADGSPSTVQQDENQAGDQETHAMAGVEAPKDDSGVPDDSPYYLKNDEGQPAESSAPVEQGDAGDAETNALVQGGQQDFKAPAPLHYQPYEDHSADEQALVDQKKSEDPTKYKPSGWRRAGAALAGALTAFGTRNAGEGTNVGEGALNAPLDRAKARWAAQEAPLKQKLVADAAADKQVDRNNQMETNRFNADERNLTNQARVADWNAQAQQRRENAQARLNTVDKNTLGPVDPTNPFGEWQGKTPGGQVVRGLEPPAAIQKDPRFIAQQRRQNLSDMQKAGVKLTAQEAKYYLVNGKLAEPTTSTHIDIHEKPDGSWAPPGNGGRGAGGGMSKSLQDRIINQKNTAMQKAQQAHAAGTMTDDEYQSALQDAQDNYEQRIEDVTGQKPDHVTVGPDFSFNQGSKKLPPSNPQQTAQPAAQPAAQPQQNPPQAQKPLIQAGNGQQLTDKSIAQQYLQKAGGNKQQARALAAKDGWHF